jgi:hypothetical protein
VPETARNIVEDALAMTNVLIAGVAPTAVQASRALRRYNNMIHAWKGQGVDVGHIDQTLDDDFALAPEHILGAKALLCVMLCGDYEVDVPAGVAAMATAGWAGLQAAYIINDPDKDMTVETGLLRIGRFRNPGSYIP